MSFQVLKNGNLSGDLEVIGKFVDSLMDTGKLEDFEKELMQFGFFNHEFKFSQYPGFLLLTDKEKKKLTIEEQNTDGTLYFVSISAQILLALIFRGKAKGIRDRKLKLHLPKEVRQEEEE